MGRAYWGVEWVVRLLLGRSIVHAYQSQHVEITTPGCFSSFATFNSFPPWPTALLGATNLQHMQEGGLSRIIQAEEEKFGMFIEQAESGQNVVNCQSHLNCQLFQ